ncbi:EKC/KEOPS complex subunit LAGE3-like isoform X2 [Lingula anatina]|uniref:L antigen family member 3 n=1 Tax=Lingula anatina TaxID=7574 RepID=A0A1S3KFB3_LINAN|nr:EKC/KEOPS complex subunit LAGE3-like isoform X1 [Lingula anatina]XP_013421178.1 EKC/KEOPS complex subunit LAGE3-like isoform X2 [Lingula anatina]|eukprot:XP_013421177.1 EKC/KEOPS complex subunit LAGE3-like isoform X1 [Lingula anatina]
MQHKNSMEEVDEERSLTMDLSVPFSSIREAEIAYRTLSVDKEPKRGGVKKTFTLNEKVLQIHFQAKEARTLRVSVNSFLDHLTLVTQTIEQFGPPVDT